MKLLFVIPLIAFCLGCNNPKSFTSKEVLNKAINYHDPNKHWDDFISEFQVKTTYPDNSIRISSIRLNLPENVFHIKMDKDNMVIEYKIEKDSCKLGVNGNYNPDPSLMDSLNISCNRGYMYKDYYTYLYGLPMKLKDPGTILNDTVKLVRFKNRDYLKLNASYNADVGSDIWNFYFNPDTFAMEVYQFFKTDDNGEIIKDSGEYILLSGIELIDDIKVPKIREWYYNKDDEHLGTDTLIKNTFQALN